MYICLSIKLITCIINQADQLMQLTTTNMEPVFIFSESYPLLPFPSFKWKGDGHSFSGIPLYNVITISPPTQIMVPSTFSWLAKLLIPTLSSLQKVQTLINDIVTDNIHTITQKEYPWETSRQVACFSVHMQTWLRYNAELHSRKPIHRLTT